MAISGSANGTATGSYNIWIVNSDGTGLTHLTANTNSGLDSIQPTFGSTSSVVYFVSKTAQNGSDNGTATSSYNVWKVNSDGTSRTPLTAYTGSGSDCQDITISPDGTTLVYASLANTGGPTVRSYNIWKMTTSGASNTYFTNNSATGLDSRYPRYSPDGSEIVFSSKMNVGGSSTNAYNIWKMSSAGASQVALTTNTAVGTDSINPIFSPDNTKIAFASKMNIGASSSSSYNIWVMDSGGSNLTALTSNTNAGLDSFLGTGRSWYAP
jgi:dipeptidyl aminopeptidase/acylaminoacyl peptidase